MSSIIARVAAAAILAAAPIAASAFTVDFTDNDLAFNEGAGSTTASNTYGAFPTGSLTVRLSSTLGNLTFSNFDGDPGDCDAAGLDCDNDGTGISDDEITAGLTIQGEETITVDFNQLVKLESIFLLDFFKHSTANSAENAQVLAFGENGVPVSILPASFFATETAVQNPGGLFTQVVTASAFINKLVFRAPVNLGADDGTNDYALAALKISPVPLPASALLLLGGLGGFAWLRRRGGAAAAA